LLLITFLLFIVPSAAQQKAGTLKLKPYTFENDKKEKVESEFGTLFVPENRSNPQSNLIELAFVRFKSTAQNPGPPIVYLAGGPGGSGIGAATGSRFPLFMALREIADVIAFDQRGTGYSKPNLGCFDRLALPLDVAPTREAAIKDARTPVSNAEEYRTGFSNSTHMIIEGAVHSDPLFLSSPKIKEGMMEFLRGQPVTATKITAAPMKWAPL